jgi:hypothetical protein
MAICNPLHTDTPGFPIVAYTNENRVYYIKSVCVCQSFQRKTVSKDRILPERTVLTFCVERVF